MCFAVLLIFFHFQFLEKGSFAAAVLAANQAAAVAYASRVANPFLDQSPNMLLQDSLALYNKILTLPSCKVFCIAFLLRFFGNGVSVVVTA